MQTLKTPVPFFLFFLGLATSAVCTADSPSPAGEVYQATIGDDGVQHVRIEGGGYFFKPDRVIVKVNVPVELTVSLEKSMIPHTLVIKSPEAGMMVDEELSSEPKRIRFTPTATGKYPFYCRNKLLFFKSHQDRGMEGMLEVVQ